jgi:type III pantothenate kinase
MENRWLALAAGNSRLHWGLFEDQQLLQVWHLPLLEFNESRPRNLQCWSEWWSQFPPLEADTLRNWPEGPPELWLASVVPSQSAVWSTYPNLHLLHLQDVPLKKVYAGLGLDRAITLWGAGITYGWPCLVIDSGTALTLTGADTGATLIGGAILPGLGLQLRILSDSTAALPLIGFPQALPELWAQDTATAIQSGVLYAAVAGLSYFILEWLNKYPDSRIVLTGGDADPLSHYLSEWSCQTQSTRLLHPVITEPHLIFLGIKAMRDLV